MGTKRRRLNTIEDEPYMGESNPYPDQMPGFEDLEFKTIKTPSCDSEIAFWRTREGAHPEDTPVVVLLHGYPQSSYMWRYVIPDLTGKFHLFVADLPGYGLSTPSKKDSSRATIGLAIMEALAGTFSPNTPVLLVGHDRGARTIQRIAVAYSNANEPNHEAFVALSRNILGVAMIDIVPYVAQWAAFANPKASVAYWHWPFLAHPFATRLIKGYGGGKLARDMCIATSGPDKESLTADYAMEHYAVCMERTSNIQAAGEDYKAGANEDYHAQVEDQKEGRKVSLPALVMYSLNNLGKMHDVPGVWKDWVVDDKNVKYVGVGNEVGHYIPEEAPDQTADAIIQWAKDIGVQV